MSRSCYSLMSSKGYCGTCPRKKTPKNSFWKPHNATFLAGRLGGWRRCLMESLVTCLVDLSKIMRLPRIVSFWFHFGNQEISALYLMRKGHPTHFPLNICKGGIFWIFPECFAVAVLYSYHIGGPFPLETFPPFLCRAKHEKQYVQTILPYQAQTYPPPRPASSKTLRKRNLKLFEKHIQHFKRRQIPRKKNGRNIPGLFGSTFLVSLAPAGHSQVQLPLPASYTIHTSRFIRLWVPWKPNVGLPAGASEWQPFKRTTRWAQVNQL